MSSIEILLPDILKEKGVSQRSLSKSSGVRLATINQMCKGNSKQLSVENLEKICNVLDVTPGDIIKHIKEPSE